MDAARKGLGVHGYPLKCDFRCLTDEMTSELGQYMSHMCRAFKIFQDLESRDVENGPTFEEWSYMDHALTILRDLTSRIEVEVEAEAKAEVEAEASD